MKTADFRGVFTALVTPFTDSEEIDWAAYDALIDAQIAGGVAGVVPCGTTGESPTLSSEEQLALVKRAVARAKGKAFVVAGTGSNSTKITIALAEAAEAAGADAVMVVCPYYNKPTPEGLFVHYTQIAAKVRCPVMIYNVPGRTSIDLLPDTVARIIDKTPNVVAMKEATGNVLRAQELVRRFGDKLAVLSGDDALTLPMVATGARGIVSVASNLLPKEVSESTALALARDAKATAAHHRLLPIYDSMFIEANPGPVKFAMAARGQLKNVFRSPMVPVAGATGEKVLAALKTAGL